MDEPTTAPDPIVPLETVAALAAEAATRALLPRLEAAEATLADLGATVAEITAALRQAAGPEGSGSRLAARLDDAARQLADLGQQLAAQQLHVAETLEQRLLPLEQLVAQLASAPPPQIPTEQLVLRVAQLEHNQTKGK